MERIKVFVVDDNANIRRGLTKLLSQSPELELVGEAGNGRDALELVKDLNPDVLLLDVEMPGMKGYEVARRLKESGTAARVLALSGYNEKSLILAMLTSGAVGYLTKDDASRYLISAVQEIATGTRVWISPNVAKTLGVTALPEGTDPIPALAGWEIRILELLAEGKTDLEIARELDLELLVVEESLQSIMNKLGVTTGLEAALRAIQEDLI